MTYAQRVAIVGATGSGKSELARHLFSALRCRRVLVDPKAGWRVAGATAVDLRGAGPEAVAAIDWTAPIVHVVPPWLGRSSDAATRDVLDALYAAIDAVAGPLHVWTDEAYGVSSASWAPRALVTLQVSGRGRGHGHTVALQRPVNVASELVSEATHVVVFAHSLEDDDVREVARTASWLPRAIGRPGANAAKVLRGLLDPLPWHAFVWLDRAAQRAAIGEPLPAALRRGGPVTRSATVG